MNKQDRELLVISLFGYFPYKCIVRVEKEYHEEVYEEFFGYSVEPYDSVLNLIMLEQLFFSTDENYVIKPYLRPMSSMTEEEKENYFNLRTKAWDVHVNDYWYYDNFESYDYLNSIHVDYRGLIEKGLAIEAPKDMYIF